MSHHKFDEAAERVLKEVYAERRRQVMALGFDAAHDNMHTRAELSLAAMCYAAPVECAAQASIRRIYWPWTKTSRTEGARVLGQGTPEQRRSECIKAMALLCAEVERLDRVAQQGAPAESQPQDDPDTEIAIGVIRNNETIRKALSGIGQIGGIFRKEDEVLALAEALGYGPGEVRFAEYERTPLPDGTIAVVKCGEHATPLLAQYRTRRLFGPAPGFRTLDLASYIDDTVTHFAVI